MHVFVIPSWVGGVSDPSSGIFMLEQAQAVARTCPDWLVTFSAVNQHILTPRLVTPGKLARTLSGLRRPARAGTGDAPAGMLHLKRHVLLRRKALLAGDIAPLLSAHRRHLELASQRERPTILHAHVAWPAGAVARELSRAFSIPYIVTEHMGPFPLPGRPLADAAGRATQAVLEPLQDADAVVAVSDRLAAAMREQGLRRPVRVIPNGVDTAIFHPGDPLPADRPFTFLAVSRLTEEKGIGDLLLAIRIFRQAGGQARFRIAGPAPAAPYRHLAARLGIEEAVTFLGPLEKAEIAAELRSAHALVTPSRHDSFGIVVIEAMASGIPVLATRSGGPEGIVTPETGLLADAAAPEDLARGLAMMIARHGTFDRGAMVAQCRSRYGADAIAARIAALYREVLAQQAAKSA